MKSQYLAKYLLIALLVGTMAACAPVQAPATTAASPAAEAAKEQTANTADSSAAAATEVVAVDPAECETVQTAIAERLAVELTMEVADFNSAVANRQGTACTLTATGTGQDFGNFVDTAQAIREVLTAEGWTENQAHIADGPTGTAAGYEKEGQLALVTVDWQPSPEVQCPADQPISACEVEPSQQIFTVVVALVQAT